MALSGTAIGIPATIGAAVAAAPAHAAGVSGASAVAPTTAGVQAAVSAVRAATSTQVVVLRYGSTGALVKVAQQRLGGLAVDGNFGPATLAKVKSFQGAHGLAVDGVVGPITWSALGGFPSSPSPSPPPTSNPPTPNPGCTVTVVRYGANNALVKVVQQRLGISQDGNFGPGTLSAVKAYQGSHGLAVDGIVGPATWSALGGFPCGTSGTPTPPPTGNLSQVVSIAEQYLGVPYVWGGESPSGFDCSGLTQYVYAKAGLSIPRTASAQQSYLSRTSNPVPGDLVFFGSPAYHVGIYLGNNQMIAAPHPGAVVRIQAIYDTPSGYGHLG
ncbi:hydrolase [Leekyejoonella antrihumi]|uniref:Hydrolase n=2 Tax=Leekyejoonella antrihumi TaxID=1660198 RepID=A0A563E922_9MICO|nr:hydrolase [Leekyejoonella antrihumi]